ncbi:MAG: Smr/MutS family protein [Desulfovibrio sp.]|jgi:DNA-nicking Smr family endonuclease|nr:Smr/MutS family protein [Desulfovibrio sp.]
MAEDFPSESELFLQIMGQVRPLRTGGRDVSPKPPAAGSLRPDGTGAAPRFAFSSTGHYLQGHVEGFDKTVINRLRAGVLRPQARLDLHGLTVPPAFEGLRTFMRDCWRNCLRTVLVIPGRGRNSPDGMGVLREKLQLWLTQEPCGRVVLAFCTAQPRDGGPGSVYVLLRKNRQNDRIDWERMPTDADLYPIV